MHPALRRFRLIGFAEGISFLLLLGIAMPLKYLAGEPRPVTWVGWAHGALFVAYVVAVGQAAFAARWNVVRIGAALFASLVPFGPFLFDAWLKKSDAAVAEEGS